MKSSLCKAGLHEECPLFLREQNGKRFKCDDPYHQEVERRRREEAERRGNRRRERDEDD